MIRKSGFALAAALWLLASCALHAQVSFTHLATQPPDNITSIVTDPTSGDLYAASTLTVIRSTDQGVTWKKTSNTGALNVNMLYVTPGGQLYAAIDKSTSVPNVGLAQYNEATDVWSPVAGAPLNITALVEDNAGNLVAGTGTTGNYGASNPINLGTGLYQYNVAGGTWSTLNSGLPFVPTYSVFPYIKSLTKTPGGLVLAGTYGNGVQQLSGAIWGAYGTGLNNQFVNTLAFTATGALLAGTDVGVSTVANAASAWSTVSTGLPANKPVRTLTINATGTLFAGLGFYVYQNGNLAGDIYSSMDDGASWQNASAGYVGAVVYALHAHSSGNLFLGSAGIWKSANNGGLWSYSMSGVSLASQTVKMMKNSAGHIFVLARNTLLGTRLPYAGVFRSTDNGVNWQQLVNGIKAHMLTDLFIDNQDNIWVAGTSVIPNAPGTGTLLGNPELYKSSNNGLTWVQNTSINVASKSYTFIRQAPSGKIFVASAFGTSGSNISSTTDFNTFDNTLNLPPINGYHTFGLAMNSANNVFLGTETNGIMRSTSGGNPGTFVSITTGDSNPGTITGPIGNTVPMIDPYTGTMLADGTHGSHTGINLYGSAPADNGGNMFPFLNFPTYFARIADVAFANTGKVYLNVQSSQFPQLGFYETQMPLNTNSTFTKTINFGTLSYYFDTLYIDKCGYLYGVGSNAGLNISNGHVNTVAQSVLSAPANGSTGVSVTPTFGWALDCIADTYRIQISTASDFSAIVLDQAAIAANGYPVLPGTLSAGNTYYWRVAGANNLGSGAWSTAASFTTSAIPSGLSLTGVQSRKSHGSSPLTFDLPIDTNVTITGAVTVEPRVIGNGHIIAFQFSGSVNIAGAASITPVGSASTSVAGSEVLVTLTNVPDNQRVTISLGNINGTLQVPPVSLGFRVGDVNNSRSVNSSDISAVKARSGLLTDATNFRFDVNASGAINASDISAVKARSGLVLP
ncbi:MAG: dockerin type I domain-containing protein [Betaproteobacteria bacterium]